MMEIEEVHNYESLPLLSLNHVSLLCRSVSESARFYEEVLGFVLIKRPSSFKFNGAWRLQGMGMKYDTAAVEDEGNRVDQVCFHDPDGYMIELCNCDNIPITPIASCSFKPRLSNVIEAEPAKCGFMENAMMESLSMEMLNIAF
ncbi:B-box type zinc finger family protein [Hibiscus syriacus]|uniref:B-box type zinc finger family protein n=1 Tax=Hibiscus syriacus TaxID=106335 RepID=A0A6A3BJR0_HIBSY|nr:B-box type zinc finger family protein [Hibiscus syriacus]